MSERRESRHRDRSACAQAFAAALDEGAQALWPCARLSPHPETAVVPPMSALEYRALRADVERRGLQEPLRVTPAGLVLDGRARLQAALELGLAEIPARVVTPADEREYIVLCALRRSHLSESQRAALVLELPPYKAERERARARQRANLRGSPEVATLPPRGQKTRDLAAELANVSPRTVQDAITVKEEDPALFEQVKAGKLPVSRAARRVRQARLERELAATPAMPEGPFQIVLADPPWPSANPDAAWSPENHYPTMAFEQIEALEIPAADDSLLFLWAVNNLLPQALQVMRRWGFEYRANLVWVKPSPGIGAWFRNRHELLLLGRRGRFPCADGELRPESVLEAPRARHSEKPEAIYELIERMYPQASKLELFARRARPGWAAFGNEVSP